MLMQLIQIKLASKFLRLIALLLTSCGAVIPMKSFLYSQSQELFIDLEIEESLGRNYIHICNKLVKMFLMKAKMILDM
jgi:hypothetical protein